MSLRDFLFYAEPGIQLYCGDCREIMPLLSREPDLVIADPPYGINLDTSYRQRGRSRRSRDYARIVGDDEAFDPSPFMRFRRVILWGANYYSMLLKPSSGWLVWDKRRLNISNDQADAELAYTNFVKGVRVFRHMWNGFLRDSQRGDGHHPTEKPVALMSWCLSLAGNVALLLDPYCGSGPSLIAAKDRGIPAIAIEIEPKYCEIAAKRLRQEAIRFPGNSQRRTPTCMSVYNLCE